LAAVGEPAAAITPQRAWGGAANDPGATKTPPFAAAVPCRPAELGPAMPAWFEPDGAWS